MVIHQPAPLLTGSTRFRNTLLPRSIQSGRASCSCHPRELCCPAHGGALAGRRVILAECRARARHQFPRTRSRSGRASCLECAFLPICLASRGSSARCSESWSEGSSQAVSLLLGHARDGSGSRLRPHRAASSLQEAICHGLRIHRTSSRLRAPSGRNNSHRPRAKNRRPGFSEAIWSGSRLRILT
jgi:hypothetical protein